MKERDRNETKRDAREGGRSKKECQRKRVRNETVEGWRKRGMGRERERGRNREKGERELVSFTVRSGTSETHKAVESAQHRLHCTAMIKGN